MGELDPYIRSRIEARHRPAVIKVRFLNYRSQYPQGLVLAVEGDDDKVVYSHWIARAVPDLAYEFFVCGGKRGVRQLRNVFYDDLGGGGKDVIFLVDRDFDDLMGFKTDENVFMLDRYSIENYLVESNVLEVTLKAAYPNHTEPNIRATVCRLFDDDYRAFLEISAELNKRIFSARRLGCDIDDHMPDSLNVIAKVELGNVEPIGADVSAVLPFDSEPDELRLSELAREFESLTPAERYRGKFAMKFFRVWLDALAKEYRTPKLAIFSMADNSGGKIKSDEFSIGSLASRSSIPEGLESFLRGGGGS
jgi:Protein of unknown function (DUF4435)